MLILCFIDWSWAVLRVAAGIWLGVCGLLALAMVLGVIRTIIGQIKEKVSK